MIVAMVLDRARAGVLYVAARDGIHRSEDGGKTWVVLNDGLSTTNIRSLAQSPIGSQSVLCRNQWERFVPKCGRGHALGGASLPISQKNRRPRN